MAQNRYGIGCNTGNVVEFVRKEVRVGNSIVSREVDYLHDVDVEGECIAEYACTTLRFGVPVIATTKEFKPRLKRHFN